MNRDTIVKYRRRFCHISFSFLFSLQGIITLQWYPNNEIDLNGYKIYYGVQSKKYTHLIDMALDTICTIDNLKGGMNYYFAITAYDSLGNESKYSTEIQIYVEADPLPLNSSIINNCYNFPNPFNPPNEVTHIRYFVQTPQQITIKIVNEFRQHINTIIDATEKDVGEHTEEFWDGRDTEGRLVQNGVYYCLIQKDGREKIIPIAIIK